MSEHDVTLTVDGTTERLTVPARTLLVHALRDAGYTAPKVGCERGTCGACTVHLDGDAVKACTVLAVQADGRSVTTAAGLADDAGDADALHPIQRRFHEEHAIQCGYCTPGLVMTTAGLVAEKDDPADVDVRAALKGNVCRCTGYRNVVRAVERAMAECDGTVTAGAGGDDEGRDDAVRDGTESTGTGIGGSADTKTSGSADTETSGSADTGEAGETGGTGREASD